MSKVKYFFVICALFIIILAAGIFLFIKNAEYGNNSSNQRTETGDVGDVGDVSGKDAVGSGVSGDTRGEGGAGDEGGAADRKVSGNEDDSVEENAEGMPEGSGEISENGPVEVKPSTRKYTKIALLMTYIRSGDALKDELLDSGFSVELFQSDGSAVKQEEQLNIAESHGAEVFIIEPAVSHDIQLANAVDSLSLKGYPVISYGCSMLYDADISYHIGYDPYGSGKKEAEMLISILKPTLENPRTVEIFTLDMENDLVYYHYPGLMETLYPYIKEGSILIPSGEVEMEQTTVFDGASEGACDRMKRLLSKYPQPDAVICQGRDIAIGVVDAYKDSNINTVDIHSTMIALSENEVKTEAEDEDEDEGEGTSYTSGESNGYASRGGEADSYRKLILSPESCILYYDSKRLAGEAAGFIKDLSEGNSLPINNTDDYDNGRRRISSFLIEPEVIESEVIEP